MFEALAQVLMKQPTQLVPTHRAFAYLVADHQGAAAALGWLSAKFRAQVSGFFLHHPEHHPNPVMTVSNAVQPVETAMPSKSH